MYVVMKESWIGPGTLADNAKSIRRAELACKSNPPLSLSLLIDFLRSFYVCSISDLRNQLFLFLWL